jgi:hypothetical protein
VRAELKEQAGKDGPVRAIYTGCGQHVHG